MRSSNTQSSEKNRKTKRTTATVLICVAASVLLIAALLVVLIVIKTGSLLSEKRKTIAEYDSYANVINDYSFILGCDNIVNCQITASGNYSRKYVYNTYSDGDDKVIFQYGLFKNNYKYEKQELFKGISQVMPFPDAALPSYVNTRKEFRHYKSSLEPEIIYEPDNIHYQMAVSFSSPMNYKEIMEYTHDLNDLGYAVKFCWVDTYLPDDITASSIYALGCSVPNNIEDYESYSDYKTAYGFLLYDNDYPEKTDFVAPAQRFIDIISTRYDDNYMSEEISNIRNNLLQKGELSEDSLDIIGVILEKQDGTTFSEDEAQIIFDNNQLIYYIYL